MIRAPDVVCIDLETRPIRKRPNFPPRVAGVSIKWPGKRSRYYACGHPTGNNCTPAEAMAALQEAWESKLPKLFFHAKFDMGCIQEGLGLRELQPHEFHDAMFLAFLYDPHAMKLDLKSLAEKLLNWPPEEQDDVKAWLWEHRRQLLADYGIKLTSSKAKDIGQWIAYAPGDVVTPYAEGDTDRTVGLWEELYPIIARDGMLPAYWREKRVQPIFMANERRGLRIDMDGLEREIAQRTPDLYLTEAWLRKELNAPGLNFDADRDVALILLDRGIVDREDFALTATGQLSMKKDVLTPAMFKDWRIASALGYRNRLVTCLHTFMEAWLHEGSTSGGRIHPNWNQIRSPNGGTRTGRPSCFDPNLLNLAKSFNDRGDGYKHPDFLPVRPLPLVRKHVLPEKGHVWLHRDFSGQELRVFADFEQGELFDAYQKDARLDPHGLVERNIIEATGRTDLDRTGVKILNFQAIYGGGIPAAQAKLGCTKQEAKAFKDAHDKALPGRKLLADVLKDIARSGDPVRTWGGRLYWCEPPKVIKGRRQTFEYKLINYIVQGSAADLTKEAMIAWNERTDGGAPFLCQVYDEMNISAPEGDEKRYMDELRDVMEEDRLEVPMRTDGKRGPTWGDLTKCA